MDPTKLHTSDFGYAKLLPIVVITVLAVLFATFFGIFLADHYVSSAEGNGSWEGIAEDLDDYGGAVVVNSSTVQVSKDDGVTSESDGLLIHRTNGSYVFCSYNLISTVTLKAH